MELSRILEIVFSIVTFYFFTRNTWRYSEALDKNTFSRINIVSQLFFITISFIGILLATINKANNLIFWNILILTASFIFYRKNKSDFQLRLPKSNLIYFFILIILVSVIRAVFTFPTNIDAVTAHLSRVLQYAQMGNYEITGSMYWALDIHPVNFASAQLYIFLVGRSFYVFQILSISWGLLMVVQTKTILDTMEIPSKFIHIGLVGFFSATSFLVAFVSSGNDIYLGFLVWGFATFLIQYRKTARIEFFYLACLALVNALGTKQTVLIPFLSLIPLITFCLKNLRLKLSLALAFSATVGFVIGCYSYIRNTLLFDYFLGSKEIILEHTGKIDGQFLLKDGPKNLIRYIFDMFSIDGFYWNAESGLLLSKGMHLIKMQGYNFLLNFNIDLLDGPKRELFWVAKNLNMSEFQAWYGPYGIMIVLPILFFGSIIYFKSRNKLIGLLYIGLVIYLVTSSFLSYYETPRCRNFIIFIPFIVIIHVFIISKNKFIYKLTNFILPILLLNAIFVTFFHTKNPLLGQKSIFTRSRTESIYELCNAENGLFKKIENEVVGCTKIGVMTGKIIDVFFFGQNANNHVYYYRSWHQNLSFNEEKKIDKLFFISRYMTPLKSDRYLGILEKIDGTELYVRDMHNSPIGSSIVE